MATKTNANPNVKYGIFTLSILASVLLEVTLPKMAKLTNNGPMVVPKLFTPPAKLKR